MALIPLKLDIGNRYFLIDLSAIRKIKYQESNPMSGNKKLVTNILLKKQIPANILQSGIESV